LHELTKCKSSEEGIIRVVCFFVNEKLRINLF